jgi:hypothetical protein
MKCQNCSCKHNGEYGSGRFCSQACARSYATKKDRVAISELVSKTLSNRKPSFLRGAAADPLKRHKFTNEERESVAKAIREKSEARPFEETFRHARKRIVFREQNGKCFVCGCTSIWNKKILIFQLHHIDGNSENNKRANVIMLCPNCHSQTPTFSRSKTAKRVIKHEKSIPQWYKVAIKDIKV